MRLLRIKFRRIVLLSILLALALHLGLLGLLGLGGGKALEPAPRPTMAVTLTQVEQTPGESPKVDESELAEQMERASRRYESRPREENLKTLDENVRWLNRYSSEQAVGEIAAVVRRATGAPERAYAPVDPPPAGDFDMQSMLLYSTQPITGEDGLERTEITWVDRAGRVMKQTSRKVASADGTVQYYHGVYGPDGKFHEFETDQDPLGGESSLFQSISQSPLLQRLYREALLPVLESQRSSRQRSAAGKRQP
jgi:hypothetical protein